MPAILEQIVRRGFASEGGRGRREGWTVGSIVTAFFPPFWAIYEKTAKKYQKKSHNY